MLKESIIRLRFLTENLPALLYEIDEITFSFKPSTLKWSKKEILGHLIDSATNNHHRFIRSQFENIPQISYNQNQWNAFNFYQKIPKNQLIEFWTVYNKQLFELIKNVPNENLKKQCKISDNEIYSIEFLISDYIEHLEHHLKHIVDY